MSSLNRAVEPFPDLVGESLDEAAFLWRRWESELSSPTRNLDEVWSWTEDRLHGALDGVRVAGAAAVEIVSRELTSGESDRIAVASGLLGSMTPSAAEDVMAAALGAADDDTLPSLVRGLEVFGSGKALRSAAAVLAAGSPAHAGALCRLKTFRRVAPGQEMAVAFESNIPDLQVEALRAARQAPSVSADAIIMAGLMSSHPAVRYTAAESGMCRGVEEARKTAFTLARRPDSAAAVFLRLLAMIGSDDDHEVVFSALRIPALQRAGVWALGHIGTPRAVESCLAGMRHESLARAAGEAYCWITGADLVQDRLAVPEPAADVPTFEEDDLDADLVPSPEALWPLPDPEAARRDWLARQARFTAGVRHIRGTPATRDTLIAMVESGPMLRRPDVVLELRIRTGGKYDVETRAFARQQRQMMAAGRAALIERAGS